MAAQWRSELRVGSWWWSPIVVWLFLSLLPVSSGALEWQVYFSPEGGATQAIVTAIERAQKSIYIQAYSFTSAPIAKALLGAQKRGVKVEAVLDKSNRTAKYSVADFLDHAGIPTFIDAAHTINHNKVMIIDEELVITGSFNFTKAAEYNNAENLLLLRDPTLAAKYLENYRQHRAHSEPYQGKGQPKAAKAKRPAGDLDPWLQYLWQQIFNR